MRVKFVVKMLFKEAIKEIKDGKLTTKVKRYKEVMKDGKVGKRRV